MIWVAWRQHRAALISLAAYAVVCVAVVVFIRVRIASVFDSGQVLACLRLTSDPCTSGLSDYGDVRMRLWYLERASRQATVGFAVLAGVVVGAPMFAREWEQRTHLLALSQSIGARRWFTTRVAVVVAATVLGAVLLGLAQWWATTWPADPADAWRRFEPDRFEAQPVALLGYTLFAVALGITAGLLLRRTLPAMAVTLLGAVGAVYAVREFARPNYLTPVVWVRPDHDPYGHFLTDPGRWALGGTDPAYPVQPGTRFWPFQFIEFGLFTAAAVALIALSLWWLRKRSL